MVKSDSRRLNIRLKNDARFMLEDLAERWGCTQTAAMERAILEAHESPFSGGVFDPEHSEFEERGEKALGANQSRCRHCGVVFERVAGAPDTTICVECPRKGHVKVGECRQCVVEAEVAKRAGESTHSEPGAVDWNPDWGA